MRRNIDPFAESRHFGQLSAWNVTRPLDRTRWIFLLFGTHMTSRSKLGNTYPLEAVQLTDQACHAELRSMYRGRACADCGATPANWATLRRGALGLS